MKTDEKRFLNIFNKVNTEFKKLCMISNETDYLKEANKALEKQPSTQCISLIQTQIKDIFFD